jgi:hypothetical protein
MEKIQKKGADNPMIQGLIKASALYYYFYSVGNGSIGISTFSSINEEKLQLLKRFRNVFDFAYRRYMDVAQAEAQAKEAKIEASLERMRAAAMSMRTSAELINVCEAMYKELTALGFTNIRNAQISIRNIADDSYFVSEYSDHIRIAMAEAPYNSSPIVKEIYDEMERSNDAFYQREFTGKEFKDWRKWRTSMDAAQDPRILQAKSMCFYLYSIGSGYLGISTFDVITSDQVEILKRFKNVFELSYQRYMDVAQAEAQAREAQIQLALERVRARTMAMQHSNELSDAAKVLFEQFQSLGYQPERFAIAVVNEAERVFEYWGTQHGGYYMGLTLKFSIDEPHVLQKMYNAWKEKTKSITIDLQGQALEEYFQFMKNANAPVVREKFGNRRVQSVATFSKGALFIVTHNPTSQETINTLERFASVFDSTYTRFLDLQKAEAQAREARIELGLERVRARAMAMQTSEELNTLIGTVFTELTKLDLVLTRCVILIYEGSEKGVRWWMANSEAPSMPMSFFVKYADLPFFNTYLKGWTDRSLKWQYVLEGENKAITDDFLFNETELSQLPDFVIAGMRAPERVYLNASFNNFGNLTLASLEPLSDEHFEILLRFAKVFDLTYTRFNDLQTSRSAGKRITRFN